LANVVVGPFPWASRRVIDLLVVPETLGWYVVLLAAVSTFWLRLDLRSRLLPIAVFAGAMFMIFALTEGNIGTLYRHRAMGVTPFVVLSASPALVAWWTAIRRRLRPTTTI
jgi:hypothetical protein